MTGSYSANENLAANSQNNSTERVEYLLNLDKPIYSLDSRCPMGEEEPRPSQSNFETTPYSICDAEYSLLQNSTKKHLMPFWIHSANVRPESLLCASGLTDGEEKTLDAIGKCTASPENGSARLKPSQ